MTKRWRQLTVWLHVLTSVGWMAQAMALCVLLAVGMATDDTVVRDAATAMAQKIDGRLLAPMAGRAAAGGAAPGAGVVPPRNGRDGEIDGSARRTPNLSVAAAIGCGWPVMFGHG